ncbi:MAG TPA: inositol monophosphatase family protein [Candidatus Binatia bacterium]|nr:inositol monophosphatase family protein [Candidatus Binatia bacterium]
MTFHDPGQFLDAAWRAASAGADIIHSKWRQPHSIDIDLVTSVDRAAEQRIVEILNKEFPDHAILAEEETTITGGVANGYRWIIDPLDGTTNFAHGYPQFSVSVALEYNNEIILGLVYDPLRHECFRAVKGQGAMLNGAAIRVSAVDELDKALLATGFPYDRRAHADFYLSFFRAFLTRSQGIRRAGSAALDLCYVASGRLDGFWELKLKPWDIAAGALMVAEAGGALSDFSGAEFSIWGNDTLASNGLIHDEMISTLKAVADTHVD